MNIFNLDNFSPIELLVSHIALKEAAREQKWKQDWLLEHAMAPLNHLFDDHGLCNPSWCHKRKQLDKVESTSSDGSPDDPKDKRDSKTYYRSKVSNGKLFDAMKKKYEHYITKEYLQQCMHSFDTQVNEGMNNSIAAYATKGKHFCTTTSLLT